MKMKFLIGNWASNLMNKIQDGQVYFVDCDNSSYTANSAMKEGRLYFGKDSNVYKINADSALTAKNADYATQAGTADSATTASEANIAAKASKLDNTSAIGGTAKPVYFSSSGVPVALSSTVGGTTQPVYLKSGTITAVDTVAVKYGGTGATSASAALSNLGGIGSITASGGGALSLSATKSGTDVTIAGNINNATTSTAGVIKVSSVNTSAVTVNSESSTEGRYYPVELNSDGVAIVNVPWTNTTYSLSGLGGIGTIEASGSAPLSLSATKSGTKVTITGVINTATASAYGVVKPNAVRASAITATNGGTTSDRYYGVEMDSNGKLFVNVPWVNNTYTLSSLGGVGTVTISTTDPLVFSATKDGTSVAITGALANSGVTAGSYGPTANVSGSNGSTISVPQITVDKYGRVTSITNRTYTSVNTDTHYTTGLKVGASATATSNAAATNGNVYLNVLDNSTVRDSHKIIGGGATTVSSDANGHITVSSVDTNYYHTPSYSSGLSIATGTGVNALYVPTATASTYGVIKVSSVNSSAVTVNSESTTSNRYYSIELNSDGTAIVNVPWSNTTYSAGTGISFSGTTINNSGVRSIATGSTNGTISVNTGGTTTSVAVKGLGSAAYTASSAYDAAGAASDALASAKTYADTAVANLVDSAPDTLNTLNELAAALGDDANFSTTVTNLIGAKVAKSGDTMTGTLTARAIVPSANNTYALGSSSVKWSNVYATAFSGSGASLTNLNASNISSGTLSSDRLPTVPVSKGGTGATTAAGALTNLGLTATATELNYTDGVTSNIQTQLNGKAPTSHASTATTYGVGTTSNYGHVKTTAGNGLSNTSGVIAMAAASASAAGAVTTGAQTFAGEKTFSSNINAFGGSIKLGSSSESATISYDAETDAIVITFAS